MSKKAEEKRLKKKVAPKQTKGVKVGKAELLEALKLRDEAKRRRPKFVRQEAWRYVRLKESWRRTKGIDSKMRVGVKGWPKIVKAGYRGPTLTRGLHPSGYRDVLVHSIREVEGLNPEEDAARLASTLGRRKRVEVMTRAKELGIKVLNPQVSKGAKDQTKV